MTSRRSSTRAATATASSGVAAVGRGSSRSGSSRPRRRADARRFSTCPFTRPRRTRAGSGSACRPSPNGRRPRRPRPASSSTCRVPCGSGPPPSSTAIRAFTPSRTANTPSRSSAVGTACYAAARGSPTHSSRGRPSATGTSLSDARSSPASGARAMASATTEPRTPLYERTLGGLRSEPKELPAVWLYDERGSRLYEEIARLPSYYLRRREAEILRERSDEIAERTRAAELIELGAGSAANTRLLLDALAAAGTLERFVPVDVSAEMLQASAREVADAHPAITVHALVGDFERDLRELPRGGRRLVAFLGSTIGNLYPHARARLLAALARELDEGDAFLVGVDLVKDVARLEAAYDDDGGGTEAFVRNALTAVNAELGASFDQLLFAYEARWDPAHEWMDIGLRARRAHTVSIPRLELGFREREWLRVEVSAKFRRERFAKEAARAGLPVVEWLTDPASDFAVTLCSPAREET